MMPPPPPPSGGIARTGVSEGSEAVSSSQAQDEFSCSASQAIQIQLGLLLVVVDTSNTFFGARIMDVLLQCSPVFSQA